MSLVVLGGFLAEQADTSFSLEDLPLDFNSSSSSNSSDSSSSSNASSPAKASTNLFFFITISPKENPELIKRVLGHYIGLGIPVDHMHIDFHLTGEAEWDKPETLALLDFFKEVGVERWTPRIEPVFDASLKGKWHLDSMSLMGAGPGDWILRVDSDELQMYPQPLYEMLEKANRLGVWYFFGVFVDRVAVDGKLGEITASTDLDRDFPWACELTMSVYRGENTKLGPYRFGLRPENPGWHRLYPKELPEGRKRVQGFKGVRVHHLKWTKEILEDLENWNDRSKVSSLIKEYLEVNQGICLECPIHNCVKVADLAPMEPLDKTFRSSEPTHPSIFSVSFAPKRRHPASTGRNQHLPRRIH